MWMKFHPLLHQLPHGNTRNLVLKQIEWKSVCLNKYGNREFLKLIKKDVFSCSYSRGVTMKKEEG